MESIDKLRSVKYDGELPFWAEDAIADIADEIEREIAERYMLLPVDAEGVPIKPGHQIELDYRGGEVWLVGTQDVMCNDGISYRACAVKHHVKQRTIEDVLRDMLNDEMTKSIFEEVREQFITKYADELRELGVCE